MEALNKSATGDIEKTVDLRDEICPMTTVKAKLHLEQINAGRILEVILKDPEQLRDVSQTLKQDGYRLEGIKREVEKYSLLIRKLES